MAEPAAFGTLLKQQRKARDLTQAELADRVGCTPAMIRMVELGKRRTSKQLAELLADHLGLAADARAAFLHAARAGSPAGPDAGPDGAPAQAPCAPNLPAYLAPLLGREEAIAALAARLGDPAAPGGARLVTLSGPAGVGKTRLAAAVAARVQGRFPDGVCFVALAPVQDPALAVSAIAAALGLGKQREHSGAPLREALTQHLRGKELLLVLDNLEQIVAAGPTLAALLEECPGVKALVTSREPLHVRGESVFPVPPLALPDLDPLPPVAALPGYAAVALFLERAQAAVPNFVLTAGNARAIATICARLDGLPLAIELVAPRVQLFSPRALLAQLAAARSSAVVPLLGDGARDLPARQRTLAAAIGWSYDLLRPAEQTLFVRLSVFVSGCTLPAIEAICHAARDGGLDALSGVASLLDKSLLQREPEAAGAEEPRFGLLETIREYALARLEEQGAAAALEVRRRHAAYFLAWAEAAAAGIVGNAQAVWMQRLARDHNNIQAALGWLLAQGEAELAARLAGAMADFWMGHTHPEALRWLLLVLEQRQHISLAVRSKVLRAAGTLAVGVGNLPLAQALAEENLEVAQNLGETHGVMHALRGAGVVAVERGNFVQAELFFRASLRLAQEVGDVLAEVRANNYLGERARAVGDYPAAQTFYESSLRLGQEAGSNWAIAVARHNLGKVALGLGNPAAAVLQLRQSLVLFQELGSQGGSAYCLAGLGEVAVQQGALERAITLLGAADALLNVVGIVLERVEQAGHDAALGLARGRLDAATFGAAWEAGRNRSVEEAVEHALEQPIV